MNKEKVIVIGTNHAGTYAVSTMADNYHDTLDITAYDANNNISFLGCGMALWIKNVIDSPKGLFYASKDSLREKGINVYMESLITKVDFITKTVHIRNKKGEKFTDNYDKLIFAVGSWPIKPDIEGIELQNVIYAKLYQHAEYAKKLLANNDIQNITVVGGGYIGLELAEAFASNNKNVTVVTSSNILSNYYDKDFTDIMKKNLEKNGITVLENQRVEKLSGNNGKVTKVITSNQEIDTDAVLMSVGFKANTKFLNKTDIQLNDNGVIIVDEHQQTSIKDVYAIGDCSTIKSNITQNDEHIALASNAVRTGIVAAHNIGGYPLQMNGSQGSNAIHIQDLTMCSTGFNTNYAIKNGIDIDSVTITDTIRADFMPENSEVSIKLLWDKKTLKLVGTQIVSNYDITLAINMFSMAIETGYTIDKLATLDLFFLPHFNKPENFITKVALKALEKTMKY